VFEVTEPLLAVMLAVPAAHPVATPVAAIVAAEVLEDEVHVTVPVKFCLLPFE
jgi:hypothetical protein